jgi:hypothetical protein
LSKPAIEGTAGMAAPLLAGFSLALVVVIAQDPTHFRWPGATLAALIVPYLLPALRGQSWRQSPGHRRRGGRRLHGVTAEEAAAIVAEQNRSSGPTLVPGPAP